MKGIVIIALTLSLTLGKEVENNVKNRQQLEETQWLPHRAEEEHRAVYHKAEARPSQQVLSSSKQFPCPVAESIAPCLCTSEPLLELNCSAVEDENQFRAIFTQEFPVKEFYGFYIGYNFKLLVLEDVFNGISFQYFDIIYTNIELVMEYFLVDSIDTIEFIRFAHSPIRSAAFPFLTLGQYTNLKDLIIEGSLFERIPKLASSSLTTIQFPGGLLTELEPGTFDDATALETINLRSNNIIALRAGTFPLHAGYNQLVLMENSIASVEPGTFILPPAAGNGSLIVSLDMDNNQMQELREDAFGEVFPYIDIFYINGNPLLCGCDIAWIVLNPVYLEKLDQLASCASGQRVVDLDPADFVLYC